MTETATREPEAATAGDTITWKRSLADYPASASWVLSYAFRGVGSFDATATADGDDHTVTITATDSAGYPAGVYHWQAYVTKGSERHQVDSGSIKILPNLADAGAGFDGRSHVKKVLDALEAMIEGKATRDQAAYTIAGRSIQRFTPEELVTWHKRYSAMYLQEKRTARVRKGLGAGNRILTRFS